MFVHRRAILRACFSAGVMGVAVVAASQVRADDANQVTIKAFNFSPQAIKIVAGTTVTWTNKDPEPHTVINKDGKFPLRRPRHRRQLYLHVQ